MQRFEPCMCGDPECSRCGLYYRHQPHYALGSLDAEDIDILNEQAAADEEAELMSQDMCDQDAYLAELAADNAQAEAQEGTPPTLCAHDLF
jgi:hypothetical protein